jgi:hypothetical protein
VSTAPQAPAQAGLSVTVTRANGAVEEYGLVSYQARNPLRQWAVRRLIARGVRLGQAPTMRASTLALILRLVKGK